MFDSEWEQGSLFGWEETIQRMRGQSYDEKQQNPLHCIACNKTYSNENVFQHHKKGRQHIKAVNEMSKRGQNIDDNNTVKSEFSENEILKLKSIAHLETWVMRMRDYL